MKGKTPPSFGEYNEIHDQPSAWGLFFGEGSGEERTGARNADERPHSPHCGAERRAGGGRAEAGHANGQRQTTKPKWVQML